MKRLSDYYASVGIVGGDRVGLGLENRIEAFTHWLALNALGASVVPFNPQWRVGELEYVLEHSELCLAVCLSHGVGLLEQAIDALAHDVKLVDVSLLDEQTLSACQAFVASEADPEIDSSTECALLYTSGTTGRPKGCMLSNEYFLSTGAWYRDIGGLCELRPGKEKLITPLPMYHMNAMATSTMGMIMTGGCIVPLDRFHPSTFWASIEESQPTVLHYLGVMPVMLMGMESVPQERSHQIRFGFGAGLSGELHTQFEERFGFKLIEAWAMSETGCTVAVIANKEPRHVGTACFGVPGSHIDYRIVDDQGVDVKKGDAGELLVRRQGDNPRYGFFSGYLKDEAATNAAWAGGYFHTGDLIRQDESGAMHFVDRKKNVIRRSGENISAIEVEIILMEHPDVVAVAVTAVPDEVRGDEVCACVVSKVPAERWSETARSIVTHCLSRLAYYKAPGYVVRFDELPLTATEKLARADLKVLAAERVHSQDCDNMLALKADRTKRG